MELDRFCVGILLASFLEEPGREKEVGWLCSGTATTTTTKKKKEEEGFASEYRSVWFAKETDPQIQKRLKKERTGPVQDGPFNSVPRVRRRGRELGFDASDPWPAAEGRGGGGVGVLALMAGAARKGRAAVVVLGDIGRSPRMQYHALSLAEQAHLEVDIVANGGTDPHMALRDNKSIHLYMMKSIQLRRLSNISGPLALLLKATIQFILLIWYLCYKVPRPDVFIVQNPPSVPTLAAVKLASWIRRTKFVVDWHNFGYSLLALSHGRNHLIVKIYHWFEMFFGKMADGCFCVTKAMQHELAQNWGIKATVLYDQPPEFFHRTSLEERHKLFCRLENDFSHPNGVHDCIGIDFGDLVSNMSDRQTIFTTQNGNTISLKPNRPALVVSSTSWTPDEDFNILLEAAVMYDRRVAAALNESDTTKEDKLWNEMHNGKQFMYPRVLFVITGKGPEREKYEQQIKKLKLRRVAFRTMWLSAEDYPLLLGSADLGVCLHTSSSGLDLPMKVVDMFGCGLPVCAVSFSCIKELVKVEENGLLFSSSSELADELLLLLKDFPDGCDALRSLGDGALRMGSSSRWSTTWEKHALPLLNKLITSFEK